MTHPIDALLDRVAPIGDDDRERIEHAYQQQIETARRAGGGRE